MISPSAKEGMKLELNFEPWINIEDEMMPLMALHHQEVGIARPVAFRPDVEQARALCEVGALVTTTVRQGGNLIGYCMWFITFDLESCGTTIASQGPFFVAPPHRKSTAGLRLLDFSVAKFREIGISNVLLHHWVDGAGERLAKKFARMGAKPLESVWSLWLDAPQQEIQER